jgi:hypothetical protein
MRASSSWYAATRTIAFVGLSIAGAACYRNPAPTGWLAPAGEAQSDPYGAWIAVTTVRDSAVVGGEFLGLARDSVFVLLDRGEVVTVPISGVSRARVAVFDARWYTFATYTGAAAVGTLSNGYFMVLSLPAMLAVGSFATVTQSRAPIVDVSDATQWSSVRKYARFPAALPDPLPRSLQVKRRR